MASLVDTSKALLPDTDTLKAMKAAPRDPKKQIAGLMAICKAANASRAGAKAAVAHGCFDMVVDAVKAHGTRGWKVAEAACWAIDAFTNAEYDDSDSDDDDDDDDDASGAPANGGGEGDDDEEDEMVAAERVAKEMAARAAAGGGAAADEDSDDSGDSDEDDSDDSDDSDEDDDEDDDESGDADADDDADAAFATAMAGLAARKGAISAAVAALVKFGPAKLAVAESGCSLMVGLSAALARDEDDADADGPHVLAVGGAARAIVACLKAHGASNAVLAQNCCRAMANLTAKCGTLGNTTAAAEIVAAGGFEAIVECCLVAHGATDATAAKYGCRALYYLLIEADQAVDGGKTAVIMRGIAAGAHDAIVACLKAHPEAQEDLAEEACSAVYGLAKDAPTEAVQALTGAGAVEAVLRSLMWYGDSNDGVAKYGCMATYSLLEGMPAGGIEAFASKDGIDALVMALIAHGAENERVAEEALTAIVAFLGAASSVSRGSASGGDQENEKATDIVAAILSADAAPEIVSAMAHHAEENEAVAEYGCRAIALLLEAGGDDALERFGALVGEGAIASVVKSIKSHVDGTPEMVTSACRVLSQLVEAKMCEANADQENAGAAVAQGGAAAAPKVAVKTKRKKKRGGRNRKKAAKSAPVAVEDAVKDARVLAVGAGGIQGIVAAMKFHGLEEPVVVKEATKALNLILKGKAEHQSVFASLEVEGELFSGVAQ